MVRSSRLCGSILLGLLVMSVDLRAQVPDITALAGKQLYTLKKCGDCHDQGAKQFTPLKAPADSAKLAAHVDSLKLENVLRKDNSPRRQRRTKGEEVAALTAYLNARAKTDAAAANLITAGFAMVREQCRNCHIVNGMGTKDGAGPDLKGVSAKHDKKWLVDHFTDPQAFVKDSVMPKYGALPKEELEAMADYLLMLK
ncbi:MAG: c-type cytochrome [bacterium]